MGRSINDDAGGFTAATMLVALAVTIVLPAIIAPDTAHARRGRGNETRAQFYGIVESRPRDVLNGVWVISGRTFETDAGTEFDQKEGKLAIGRCVKVHIRNDRVHEIDSEPMSNCR